MPIYRRCCVDYLLRCIVISSSVLFLLLISIVNNRICNYTNSNLMWKRLSICVRCCSGRTQFLLQAIQLLSCAYHRNYDVNSYVMLYNSNEKREENSNGWIYCEWMKIPSQKYKPKHFIETPIHPYMHHSIWRKRLFDVFWAMWSERFVTISAYFFFYTVAVVFVTVFFIWKCREWVNSTICK